MTRERGPSALERLREFCRIPSISTSLADVARAADWLVTRYGPAADRVDVFEAEDGTPIGLLLEFDGDDAAPLVFYNYYDVTSPGDEQQWSVPPFDASIFEGRMYARGAAGNKGDLVARLEGIVAARDAGGLRRRVVCWLDGQEELGAANVPAMLRRWRERLEASTVIWNTGFVNRVGVPALSVGFKGIVVATLVAVEDRLAGHSGVGLGTSGVHALLNAVRPLLSAKERHRFESLVPSEPAPCPKRDAEIELAVATELFEPLVAEARAGTFGPSLVDADTRAVLRQVLFTSTVNVPWISGGSCTELTRYAPAAECALDIRLVPPQQARAVIDELSGYFKELDIAFHVRFNLDPYVVESTDRVNVVELLDEPLRNGYSQKPRILSIAPSGAPAAFVAAELGAVVVGIGLTDPDARPHGTNESVSCALFSQTVEAVRQLVAR